MKNNITNWLLLLALCNIFVSCKKDKPIPEEQLPPETQTGAYTLGFKVDGVIYKASGKGGLLTPEEYIIVITPILRLILAPVVMIKIPA